MSRPENPGRIPLRWSPSRRRDVRNFLHEGLSHGQFDPAEQGLAEDIVCALKNSGPQLTRDQVETAGRLLAKLLERSVLRSDGERESQRVLSKVLEEPPFR